MVHVLARLAGIFLIVYLAVYLGYARLEKELLNRSCCITGLPSSTKSAGSTGTGDRSSASSSAEPVRQALDTKKPNFQIIVRRNIFQLVEEEKPKVAQKKLPPPPVPKKEETVMPTQLKLTLLGTIQGDEQTSRAIIMGGKKKEQKLYRVGDPVKVEGTIAIIESIERGQVVLDVSGRQEILTMKKRRGGGPGLPNFSRRGARNTSSARSTRSTRNNRRNRTAPPEPEIPDDLEELELEEENQDFFEDELATENTAKKALVRRRPPPIRPHRRINFRRNPIRNIPKMDGDESEDFPVEEEILLDEE